MNENGKFFLCGDSTTCQVFGEDADPRNLIGHRITERCPINVTQFGAVGQRVSWYPGHETTPLALISTKEGIAFAQGIWGDINIIGNLLGFNDWKNGNSQSLNCYLWCTDKVVRYYKRLQIPDIFLISPYWTMDQEEEQNEGGFFLQDFRDGLEAKADYLNVHFIDGRDLIPQNQIYFSGGVHPNNLGHMTAANNLTDIMQGLNLFPVDY